LPKIRAFFEHVDRPMRIMPDLLGQDRDPAEVTGFINTVPPPGRVPQDDRAFEKPVMV
jgi:hypothetical protein